MPLIITGMEHQFSHISHWILCTWKDLFGKWEYLTVKMYLLDRLHSGGFESCNIQTEASFLCCTNITGKFYVLPSNIKCCKANKKEWVGLLNNLWSLNFIRIFPMFQIDSKRNNRCTTEQLFFPNSSTSLGFISGSCTCRRWRRVPAR